MTTREAAGHAAGCGGQSFLGGIVIGRSEKSSSFQHSKALGLEFPSKVSLTLPGILHFKNC